MAELNLNDGQIMAQTNANETPLNANADETGAVISTPATNKTQAKNSAKGKVKTSAMTAIEAEAETIGLPYLKARETITIENIGKKFSGEWRITKVRHEISSSGYICSLSLAKNNFSGGKKNSSVPKASTSAKNNNAKPANEVKQGTGKKTQELNLNNGVLS